MRKNIYFILLLAISIFMSGCGEDESSIAITQGSHFQGRDCLACHNSDLQISRHLLFAGTVYKSEETTNKDDLKGICGGNLNIEFWNSARTSLLFTSQDYKDVNSKGYNGKGNIFILKRVLNAMTDGYYAINITDANGIILAQTIHQFSGKNYDITQPDAYNNRVSCNACHSHNGIQAPIYVDSNKQYLCK